MRERAAATAAAWCPDLGPSPRDAAVQGLLPALQVTQATEGLQRPAGKGGRRRMGAGEREEKPEDGRWRVDSGDKKRWCGTEELGRGE